MSECLTAAIEERYISGHLSGYELDSVEEHLSRCERCLDDLVSKGQDHSLPSIENCHIVGELGSGRFGVVYKAWWLKDEPRLVAVKCLSFAGAMERERFEREIKVLTEIDSPHIVKCFASGVAGGTSYFVMDLIRGVHLDEYLEISASGLEEKLTILQRVCGAVAEAHSRGVIHRDLKPRNILIDSDGQPHILDFGICGLEAEGWDSSVCQTITRPGDIIGTLKYMSPEQAWGGVSGPIDERSDTWALGVMLFEIVTNGDYPYDLRSTADKPAHEALLERIRKEMPAIPRLRSIERGRQLEVLLERCLAWERGQRLGSVAQLEADIGRYLQNQRIKTKPLSMSHRLRRLAVGFATKARWAALAAVIALVMTVLICATFWFDVRWRAAGYDYAGDASTASIPAGDGRDSMVVVGISDDTVEAIGAFARESGFSGVTTDVRTFRAVHGYLMERLASAAPKAVVWDYYFRTPRPGDSSFVAGVDALESARIPVLLASQTYDDYGNPDLSHNITDVLGGRIRHGAIVARHMVEREGEFVMAIRRSGGACIPSLALATLAAVLHPNTRLEIGWSHDDRDFDLLYETAPGAFLREHDRLGLTKVFHSKLSASAVREGDLLGCKTFEFQKPEQWEAQTVTYEYLLTCDDDELRTKVMNKILLVGDLRKPRLGFHADRHSVRYGSTVVQDVPGCYLLADAIAGLLNRRYMKAAFPPAPAVILLILLLAVVGGLVPMGVASSSVLENPRNRRILWMSLLGLAAWCFVMMVLSEGYASVHLGMAGFSLLLVTCGSFWVEFTRNQHRMLERERGAVDNLAIGSERTLTILRSRSKPSPTERR